MKKIFLAFGLVVTVAIGWASIAPVVVPIDHADGGCSTC